MNPRSAIALLALAAVACGGGGSQPAQPLPASPVIEPSPTSGGQVRPA